MKNDLVRLLAASRVFKSLDATSREQLASAALSRKLAADEYLAHYGDVWPFVFLVEKGLIRVVKISAEGRMLGALRLESGGDFWSPSIFDLGPLPASLIVDEPTRIFLWSRERILPLVQKNPDALWEICLLLMERIRQASRLVEELSFHPLRKRLARYLLSQFDLAASKIAGRVSLEEMGTLLGTTPVMVCKILSSFADTGLIRISRTDLELFDREALEKIAGESER